MNYGGETFQAHVVRSPRGSEPGGGRLLIGSSPTLMAALSIADAVATNDCVVLLEGESGTGKELFARRIHQRSKRNAGPFIPLNCAGISESLFESQLFGHIRGAFTGAVAETLGVVRSAEGGTLLLDEVGDIPLHLQPKLLRLIQEREVIPVGGARPIPADVRFIAATNRALSRLVIDGAFREDLYHRLNIVRIEIPPLRVRPEDIEELLEYYLRMFAHEYRMPKRGLGDGIRRQLCTYSWPGNVRELASYIERLYAADIPPLPPAMIAGEYHTPIGFSGTDPAPGRMTELHEDSVAYSLADAEQSAVLRALQHTAWNRSAAARLLGVHRSTLLRKMRNFGIDDGR